MSTRPTSEEPAPGPGARPLLILDLDETLILAEQADPGDPGDFRVGPYSVRLRPHLEEFMAGVDRLFDLAVWTSSTEDYAAEVVARISADTGVRFQFVWGRERCTQRFDFEHRAHYWVKDLKKVKRSGYDIRRVLIVDDTARKLERSYGNHILIREFTGNPDDEELRLLGRYLEGLANQADFRRVEKRRWRSQVEER